MPEYNRLRNYFLENPALNVALGPTAGCAIVVQDGSLVCFGVGAQRFVAATPSGEFTAVAVGDTANACALRAADSFAVCWGPLWGAAVHTYSTAFSAITVGAEWVCAIRALDSRLQCFGVSGTKLFSGNAVFPTEQVVQLTARGNTLCTIAADGRPTCYGEAAGNHHSRVHLINSPSQAAAVQMPL
jgi:hypothetical protein